MFWFKQCPRCSGDLVAEYDQYGAFISCMQCGMCKDITSAQIDPSQINLESVPVPPVPQSGTGIRRRMSHGGRHIYRGLSMPIARPMAS